MLHKEEKQKEAEGLSNTYYMICVAMKWIKHKILELELSSREVLVPGFWLSLLCGVEYTGFSLLEF